MRQFSVLLLYPMERQVDDTTATYFQHVKVLDVKDAVRAARAMAVTANDGEYPAGDFEPLLVIAGFHDDLI